MTDRGRPERRHLQDMYITVYLRSTVSDDSTYILDKETPVTTVRPYARPSDDVGQEIGKALVLG